MEYFFNFNKIAYLRGKRPDGCILCLIRDGSPDVDRLVVHETARFLVTLNLYPYNPGHLLVFPKRHVLDLRELDRDESLEQDQIVRLCLDVLDRYGKPSAYNIGYNMGLNAGASIDHLHLHIIPRYPREIGIAELIGGARVLVQDPKDTQQALRALFDEVQSNPDTDE
ncbi:MAG: HIT domain-containing protein [Spirochaetales bacterium]|nr:HIT domain-containing protein [Spirochaetales bacterium]